VQVDFLAELMGLKKVGWVFAQSNKQRDYIISGAEVAQMAAVQVGAPAAPLGRRAAGAPPGRLDRGRRGGSGGGGCGADAAE
jgi:hypothetical protein